MIVPSIQQLDRKIHDGCFERLVIFERMGSLFKRGDHDGNLVQIDRSDHSRWSCQDSEDLP